MDDPRQRNVLIAVAALVAIVAAALIGVALAGGDDDGGGTTTTTTSSTVATTTSSSSTSSTLPPTTTTVSPEDLEASVYPPLTGSARFADPADLVTAFATELLGFDTDVVVGAVQQGRGPSGSAVVIHPPGSSATTTVAVRQLPDASWIVLGATTPTIRLDAPAAHASITSPLELRGAATAFEGHVDVMLYVDGEDAPLATGKVTGRGDGQLGDFTGRLPFQPPPPGTGGVLVLSSPNGDDGTTVAAVAVRVRF